MLEEVQLEILTSACSRTVRRCRQSAGWLPRTWANRWRTRPRARCALSGSTRLWLWWGRVPATPASKLAKKNNNVEMEAWFARLVLFIDQAGTENGRTQLAWLLAGLPEPSRSTMMRRESGITPSRKAARPFGLLQIWLIFGRWTGSQASSRAVPAAILPRTGERTTPRPRRTSTSATSSPPSTVQGRPKQLRPRERSACQTGGVELRRSAGALLELSDSFMTFSDPCGAKPSVAPRG